jgi:molybdate transport system regulatory protein
MVSKPLKIINKVWLEKDGKVVFGIGRGKLLQAVEDYGSLYCAAKRLNMSYRAAWGKIKKTEQRLGLKLVETHEGSRGMQLTPAGKRLLDEFYQCEEDIRSYVKSRVYHFILRDESSGEEE